MTDHEINSAVARMLKAFKDIMPNRATIDYATDNVMICEPGGDIGFVITRQFMQTLARAALGEDQAEPEILIRGLPNHYLELDMSHDVIPDPPTDDEDFPLNAIGRNDDGEKWMEFHMRADGKQCDRRGLLIYPFEQVQRHSPSVIAAMLSARGEQIVKLVRLAP